MIVYNYSANTHTENNEVNMKPLIPLLNCYDKLV